MPTHADDRALKAVLSAAIGAHLGILHDLGYRAPALATTDSVVLPGVRATFTAPTRELWVDVAHPSTDPRALKRHVMVAFVYRRGEGREGSLYVDWFAAVHRPDLFDALERLANGGGTLNEFVRAALPVYATLIREDLCPIVSGESWEDGDGDPAVARAFAFLERDHGFSKPDGRRNGHEQTHVYTRGDAKVTIDWDNQPEDLLTIEIGNTAHGTWRIRFADAAESIKAHPEVLSGDFRPTRDWKKVG